MEPPPQRANARTLGRWVAGTVAHSGGRAAAAACARGNWCGASHGGATVAVVANIRSMVIGGVQVHDPEAEWL